VYVSDILDLKYWVLLRASIPTYTYVCMYMYVHEHFASLPLTRIMT
jgi:hypothetical protein